MYSFDHFFRSYRFDSYKKRRAIALLFLVTVELDAVAICYGQWICGSWICKHPERLPKPSTQEQTKGIKEKHRSLALTWFISI